MNSQKPEEQEASKNEFPKNCRASGSCQRIATVEIAGIYGWMCEVHAAKMREKLNESPQQIV